MRKNNGTNWTPGPWKVLDRRQFDGNRAQGNLTPWTIYGDGDIAEPIANVVQDFVGERPGATDEMRAEANARLIALAPELVEALRAMLTQFDCQTYQDQFGIGSGEDRAVMAARALLARLEEGGPNCPCEMCKEERGDILT